MAESWATSGVDLHLDLAGPGLREGLTDALRDAVRTKRLPPGTRLPSSRTLATDLGVARNTVANAYAELIAEGWLTAQQGSGTRVARRVEPRRTAPAALRPRLARQRPAYSLLTGSPNLAQFPRKQWLAAARRALTAAPHEAFALGEAHGRIELRTALADYLARSRGVYADPERIVICSGFHHALGLMAQALKARRVRAVAVESYGLDIYREQLSNAGLRIPPLYVDDHGARTE
ncbi:MAG TPA: aminotransferase class I/II-fold pyridoxal phosphate-dependent enzyme, partial [Asanoa sp.]|nr:aminotransferase class I/II-fold pyridoxal phosphate-dependent enzyme [Asanoa sp.]